MHAEIVLTGTELLLGELVDTNSALVARMLRDIGLDLFYVTTVGDNEQRIGEVVELALNRSGIVIVSGGLGPTVDDVTRQAIARATARKLVYSTELEDQIAARFRTFGRNMAENNKRQAWIPEEAVPITNPVGTAPAFRVHDPRGIVISLPGVPRELEYLMQNAVIPFLKDYLGDEQIIVAKTLRTCAVGESDLDNTIGDLMHSANPSVGLAAHPGQVDIRLAAKARNEAEARTLLQPLEAELRQRLGGAIYGEGQETVAEVVGRLLAEHNVKLAVLDTLGQGAISLDLTRAGFGGYIAADHRPSTPDDASQVVGLEGLDLRQNPGQVTETIASLLAQTTDLGLVLVGPLDKDGQTGHNYLAISDGKRTVLRHYQYGDSSLAQVWLSIRALDLVRRWLLEMF